MSGPLKAALRDILDVGSRQAAGDVLGDVSAQPEALNPAINQEAMMRISQMPPGPKRDVALGTMKRFKTEQQKIRKATNQAERTPGADQNLTSVIEGRRKGTPDTTSPLHKFFQMLELPDRAVRTGISTLSQQSLSKGIEQGRTSESFHEGLRKSAGAGEPVAQSVEGIKKPLNDYLGPVGGVLNAADEVVLPGVISGIAKSGLRHAAGAIIPSLRPSYEEDMATQKDIAEKWKNSPRTTPENIGAAYQRGKQATGDLAFDLATSPWNFMGARAGVEASKALAGRLLKEVGPEAVAKAGPAVERLLATKFTPATFGKLKNVLESAGVATDRILGSFGQRGEMLNRGQMTFAGKSLSPEYGIEKAVQRAVRPVQAIRDLAVQGMTGKARTSEPLFQGLQEGRFLKANEQGARGSKELIEQQLAGKAQKVFEASKGMDAARVAEVAAPAMKPGTAAPLNIQPNEQIFLNELHRFLGTTRGEMARAGVKPLMGHPSPELTPEQFVDAFNRSAAGGFAMKGAENRLAGFMSQPVGGLSAPGVEASLARTFDQLAGGGNKMVRDAIDHVGQAGFPLVQAGLHKTVDAIQTAQSWWRSNVTARVPRYHIINAANDITQMGFAGMNNVPSWLLKARSVVAGDPNFSLTVGNRIFTGPELKELSNRLGIGLGGQERLDLALAPGKMGAGAKALAEAGGRLEAPGLGQRALEVASGRIADRAGNKLPINAAFGNEWEKIAKTALFLHELSRGHAPQVAAETAFKFLIDWGDKGKTLQVARWFVPFVNYLYKAPKMAAFALARHPARVMGLEKVVGAMSQNHAKNEEPVYRQAAESQTVRLAPYGAIASARQALGAPPVQAGTELRARARLPVGEALGLPAALATGNLGAIAESSGPLGKALYEISTGKDLLTGGDKTKKRAVIEALAPVLLSGPAQIAWNRGLSEAAGAGAPARPLGFSSKATSKEEATAADILNALGITTFETGPQTKAANVSQKYLEKWLPDAKKFQDEKKAERKRR